MELFDVKHLKKTYFSMSLPVVFGLIVTLIYNLADTYFITATGDDLLIAGVSLCSPLFTALMAFGNIFGQGGSSVISRLLGQKEDHKVRQVSSFCFYIAIITGIVLAVILLTFRIPLMTLMGVREETLKHASDYYVVLALGAPVIVLSFIHANLVRCEGMSAQSMIGSILGSIVNIILDPILISVLGMGTKGAAIATVIGYLCSVIYLFLVVKKKSANLSTSPRDIMISLPHLSQIMGVGISAALANLMSSVSVALLNNALLTYGNKSIAAMGIVLKIVMIAQLILTGFAFGSVPLFGYLYGSKNKEKIRELTRFIILFMSSLAVIFTLALGLGRTALMNMFSKDAEIIGLGGEMLLWQVLGNIFAGLVLFFTVMFQATGKSIPALVMSVSRQGVIYFVCIFIMSRLLGYSGVISSQFVSDIASSIIGLILYLIVIRRGKDQ